MTGIVKCPSCLRSVSVLVVDTMRWRGSMPAGSKLFAATCPLCGSVISASVLFDPGKTARSLPPKSLKARRALNRE
jgi:hypothetical protein